MMLLIESLACLQSVKYVLKRHYKLTLIHTSFIKKNMLLFGEKLFNQKFQANFKKANERELSY